MPTATPRDAGVHGEGQRMPRHQRTTPGHSPCRHEVPDRRARRADAAAGREGSSSAERSSEKKVGSEAATPLQARLLPSRALSAMFGGSCCRGKGSVASGAAQAFARKHLSGEPLGSMYGRMTAQPLHATDWSKLQDCKSGTLSHASSFAAVSFLAAETEGDCNTAIHV